MSKIGLNDETAYQAARGDLLALADAPKVDPKVEIENLERQAMLQDIPGFFPTPLAVGEQVMQAAGIEPGMSVLEPSAGSGPLVAIMYEGPFFRSDRKAEQFRAWLDAQGGHSEQLPANSFKESGTGVATRLVVVER